MVDSDTLFVQLAVQRGIATQQAARECNQLRQSGGQQTLAQLLVERARIPQHVASQLFREAQELARRQAHPQDLQNFISDTSHHKQQPATNSGFGSTPGSGAFGSSPAPTAPTAFGTSPGGAGNTPARGPGGTHFQRGPGNTPVPGTASSGPGHTPWPTSSSGSSQNAAVSTPQSLQPGMSFNRYLLEAELGRGGMGVVWKARQVDLDRNVAIKMLLQGSMANEKIRQRFVAEAKAVARLLHPNVVTVHDVGEHDGILFFTMDFVDGPPLSQYLKANTVSVKQALELGAGIAEGLDHAHKQGIVHRDLKPANILIDPRGAPRITDFGIAKDTQALSTTAPGQVLGTPSYMAPEQAEGAASTVDGRADVFSLGAILYRMLCATPPFKGDTPYDVIQSVLRDEPESPRKHNKEIPSELNDLILKCLAKGREQRFASAAEVARSLRRQLRRFDEETQARSGGGAGSKILAIGLLVTGLLLLGGVGVFIKVRADEQERIRLQQEEEARRKEEARKAHEQAVSDARARIAEARGLKATQPQAALAKAENAAPVLVDDAGAQVLLGELLLTVREDAEAALKPLNAAITIDDQNAEALRLKGRCLLALKKPDRDLEAVARKLERLGTPEARAAAAELRCDLALSKEELSVAIVHLDQALRNADRDPRLRLRMVKLLVQARRFASAEEEAGEAIRLDSGSADAYALRAKARLSLERFKGAGEDVRAALGIDPNHSEALALQKKIKAAETSTTPTGGGETEAHKQVHRLLSLASQAIRGRDLNRAKQALQQAFQREPRMSCATALQQRAQLALMIGYLNEGLRDLSALRKLKPDDLGLVEMEAVFRMRMGRQDEALQLFSAVLERDPSRASTYANRANIREGTGDLEGALEDLNQAITKSEGKAKLTHQHARSHLYSKMGRHEEALADTEICLEAATQKGHYLYMKAVNLKDLGRTDDAVSAFEAVVAAKDVKQQEREAAQTALSELKGS